MARWEVSVKRWEWSERLRRFAWWGGTVAEFCDAERVSAPSLYQWKRKLAAGGTAGAGGGNGRCSAPDRRSIRKTSRTFPPVQLVSATAAGLSAAAATVEIELPNGKSETVTLNREIVRVDTLMGDRRTDKDAWDYLYDKGSVQNIINLEDGKSALKLTTAGYLRPSGKNIHRADGAGPDDEWGVKPNDGFEVKNNDAENTAYLRYRRERDILKKEAKEAKKPKEGDPAPFVDKQLQSALDYLSKQLAEKPAEKGGEGGSAEEAGAEGRRLSKQIAVDSESTPNDLWAIVYRHLGINTEDSFPDHRGRPMPILPEGEPITELLRAS